MKENINSFLTSLKSQGKSDCTVSAYKIDLAQFDKAMDKPLTEIRYSDLQNWSNRMADGGLSASSRARKISAVKSFFKYLTKMEFIDRNPAENLEIPKIEKKEPKVISMDDASEVLFMAKNDGTNERTWFRDYTVVAMFLFTGIRREELTNIRMADVYMDAHKILIHGKGNKQRTVYMNDMLHSILSEYIMKYRKDLRLAEKSSYLFVSNQSEKMSVNTVNNIINTMFEKAGIKEKGVSAHILRKRFATTVFNSTHDVATVSKMLGHSSPTVTMRYLSIGEDTMRQAVNAVNF